MSQDKGRFIGLLRPKILIVLLFFLQIFIYNSNESYGTISKISCVKKKTSICTIEIWLAHKHKKDKHAIYQRLRDSSIKVIRSTVQFWRAKGGHPPENIAIGRAVKAEDARYAINLALELNDNIEYLVIQRLNPPNYVAIGTSAWDEKSLIKISPSELKELKNPALTTEEFHKLYLEFTGELKIKPKFY